MMKESIKQKPWAQKVPALTQELFDIIKVYLYFLSSSYASTNTTRDEVRSVESRRKRINFAFRSHTQNVTPRIAREPGHYLAR